MVNHPALKGALEFLVLPVAALAVALMFCLRLLYVAITPKEERRRISALVKQRLEAEKENGRPR